MVEDEEDSDEATGKDVMETNIVKRFRKMESKMELMYNDLKKEMELMKGAIGKKGEEIDKEKYLKLIAEYKTFKKKNVQHFRFSSVANLSNFGKSHTFFRQQKYVKQFR